MIIARDKIKKEYRTLWDKGYEVGYKSRPHSDQFLQTQWNKRVLFGKETYFEFKTWEAGYWSSRRDCFWGLGKFSEDVDDDWED